MAKKSKRVKRLIKPMKQLQQGSLIVPSQSRVLHCYEEDVKQSIAFYEKDDEGEVSTPIIIEKTGRAIAGTWGQQGKRVPRYRLFLNPHQDTRFTTCPRCEVKTRPRTFCLAIGVYPTQLVILDQQCRYCDSCSLLIVHQDQLEATLAQYFRAFDPDAIGNDYRVLGTLNRAQLTPKMQETYPADQIAECLHDFKEVVTYERVSR